MWILPLVGYTGVLLGFGFLTLAIASGLYYLSELVEEHTVFARKLLTRLIYAIIAIQTLLTLIDRFPLLLSLVSIVSHGVYMGNLRHFPIVKLTDPVFILSCVLVLLNHFLWFRHFSTPPSPSSSSRYPSSIYDRPEIPTFTEIASYFGICVWLVPFALFVSLSAGENVLPSMGSEYATGGNLRKSDGSLSGDGDGDGRARRKKGLVKAAVDWVVEWIGETGGLLGLWRGDKVRRF
ncbi:MAG: hypothetical protein Q9161_007027 [Pseudevernia consocians]